MTCLRYLEYPSDTVDALRGSLRAASYRASYTCERGGRQGEEERIEDAEESYGVLQHCAVEQQAMSGLKSLPQRQSGNKLCSELEDSTVQHYNTPLNNTLPHTTPHDTTLHTEPLYTPHHSTTHSMKKHIRTAQSSPVQSSPAQPPPRSPAHHTTRRHTDKRFCFTFPSDLPRVESSLWSLNCQASIRLRLSVRTRLQRKPSSAPTE
jgi:hypothetical protein